MVVYPSDTEPAPLVKPFHPRGRPGLAWLVIAGCVVFTAWSQMQRSERTASPEADRQGLVVMQLQARYLVGLADLLKQNQTQLAAQAELLNTGGVGQRLRYVVLIGELQGPAQGREAAQRLNEWLTEHAAKVPATLKTLTALYTDYAAGDRAAASVTDEERDALRKSLGWFGRLALAPANGPDAEGRESVLAAARKTASFMLGGGFAFLMLLGVGSVIVAIIGFQFLNGRLRTHFRPGSAAGGLYAETFAVWMVLFLLLMKGAGSLDVAPYQLPLLGGAMLLSLAALAWPVWRGLSWRQVRQEIGLTAGYQPRREPFIGIATWVMAVPMLAIGLGLTLLLMRLQHYLPSGDPGGSNPTPSHPIVDILGSLGFWGRLQVLVLVSVIAPLVEETLFRGVLYRHLREASIPLGRIGSVLCSGTVVSFIFAVIHPQGLVAVPALMGLAYAFTLAREWRGTLVPAMVAHAIQNGTILLALSLLLE